MLLISKCSKEVLGSHFVPLLEVLKNRNIQLWNKENYLSSSWNNQNSDDDARSKLLESLLEVLEEARAVCS